MAQQGYEGDLLHQWFPVAAEDTEKRFTESDIRGIADVLKRSSRETWSRIPRIYSVLRKIGQLDVIDAFVNDNITDVSFPFSKSTLPEGLRSHAARLRFLELQHLVYNTEALNLEHARHGHFSDDSEVPLKRIGDLGKGAFGYVDQVISTISNKEYARKRIARGRTFRRDKEVLRLFIRELSSLKRLSHRHLIELVGSYTDKKYVAIIMLPVADCNLQVFLEAPGANGRAWSFLRPFFGCLTSALSYLHDNCIRHKDIKPSNILIKSDQVYFTDFGTSLDWSERGNSTTATSLPTTPRYCPPEVMAYAERNSMSDIWSLGCVFLEMWTVLKHRTLEDLKTHMEAHATKTRDYYSNHEGITTWVDILHQTAGPPCDLTPSTWIMNMLQHKPSLRWSTHTLVDRIHETSIDPTAQYTFSGLCCLQLDDDTSEETEFLYEHSESSVISQSVHQSGSSTPNLVAQHENLSIEESKKATILDHNSVSKTVRPLEPVSSIPSIVIKDCAPSRPAPRPYVEDEGISLAREVHISLGASVSSESIESEIDVEAQSNSKIADKVGSSASEADPSVLKSAPTPQKPSFTTHRSNHSTVSIEDIKDSQSRDSHSKYSSSWRADYLEPKPAQQADRHFAPTRFTSGFARVKRVDGTQYERSSSVSSVERVQKPRKTQDYSRPVLTASKHNTQKPKDTGFSRIKSAMRGVFNTPSTESDEPTAQEHVKPPLPHSRPRLTAKNANDRAAPEIIEWGGPSIAKGSDVRRTPEIIDWGTPNRSALHDSSTEDLGRLPTLTRAEIFERGRRATNEPTPIVPRVHRTVLREPEHARHRSPSPLRQRPLAADQPAPILPRSDRTRQDRNKTRDRETRSDRKFVSIESESSTDEKARYEAEYKRRSQEEEARNLARNMIHDKKTQSDRKFITIESESSADSTDEKKLYAIAYQEVVRHKARNKGTRTERKLNTDDEARYVAKYKKRSQEEEARKLERTSQRSPSPFTRPPISYSRSDSDRERGRRNTPYDDTLPGPSRARFKIFGPADVRYSKRIDPDDIKWAPRAEDSKTKKEYA